MKKITPLILFILAATATYAQFGYTVVKHETFESPDFETTFSRAYTTATATPWSFLNTASAGYAANPSYWNDMFCNATVVAPTVKDNTMNIVNTTANAGAQSLKVFIGPVVQSGTTMRIRANAGAYGFDGTTNLTGTTANTIGGAWTNYLITFYAKTDAGSPAEGKAVFKNSTQTLTSNWQKFNFTNGYSSNNTQTTMFIDFLAIDPIASYDVYLDDIKVLKTVQPTTSAATNITASSFTANWNTVSDATSYSVTVEKSDGGTTPVWTAITGSPFTATTNSLEVTGLDVSATYRYKFTASDGTLTSVVSTITTAVTSPTTGVENINTSAIYVLNNHVVVNTSAENEIVIFNANGQKVLSTVAIDGKNEISLSRKGIYIVKSGNISQKIVL